MLAAVAAAEMWWNFAVPEIGGNLHAYLENGKSYDKVTGWPNTLDPSTISYTMLRFAFSKAGERIGSVPKNSYPKMRFGEGKWSLVGKISQLSSKRMYDDADCVQISRKSAAWKWVKRCVVSLTKSRKVRFNSPTFCSRLAESAKRLQGSVLREPTSDILVLKYFSSSSSLVRSH